MKRVFFVIVIFALVFAWSAVPAKADSPHQTFYLEKVCGATPNVCVIDVVGTSELSFLTGATLQYTNHTFVINEAGVIHQAATVLITATDGSTAVGHVSWTFYNGEFSGTVTIQPGTGSLAGFHANGDIGLITWPTRFSFSGNYFFTP